MRRIHDDELQVMTVSDAARLTGLTRDIITQALNLWTKSRGSYGLRFIRPVNRRMIRRSELLTWFENLEDRARYA